MIGALAGITHQEATRQTAHWVITGTFGFLILLSGELALFGLGEEELLLRELGISSVSLATSLLVFLLASRLIREELEEKTLMTILSRPVARWQVYLGKLLGILRAVCSVAILLALCHVAVLWIYHGYPEADRASRRAALEEALAWRAHHHALISDPSRLASAAPPPHVPLDEAYWSAYRHHFHPVTLGLLQSLILICLHIAVLTAIAAGLSTRFDFPMAATLGFVIFACGNLAPYLQDQLRHQDGFLAQITAAGTHVLPNLSAYSMPATLARQTTGLAWGYVSQALTTATLYTIAATCLGMWLFSRTEAGGSRS